MYNSVKRCGDDRGILSQGIQAGERGATSGDGVEGGSGLGLVVVVLV